MPLPRRDSNFAILKDLFGTSRIISISGIITGTTSVQKTFIAAIEGIADGSQSSSPFISSLITSPSSYNVFIQTFSWSKDRADPNKISYTLTMVEGAAST